MRQVQLGYSYMTDEIGMRSAFGQFARQLAEQLVTANAVGRFEKPVLGSLTNAVKSGAKWTDEYPAWQKYADEFEELLQFAKKENQFDKYLGALQGSNSQRDSAIAELRVARHFSDNGFRVVEWKPKGAGGNEGEFFVEGSEKQRVFVEVKSPGWEGQVTPEERRAGRLKQGKYIDGEGGAVETWQKLRFAIDKAYKKFGDNTPNLLIIADDLFIGLTLNPSLIAGLALYASSGVAGKGYFADQKHQRLGGVGLFEVNQQLGGSRVTYQMTLFLNLNSLPDTMLPLGMCRAFDGMILPSE
ncbi:MAG TPA: hypothetical protein VGY31_15450 [Terriglobia bacterium]|nr:hypothetical protein [Terriglobia bacterium]